MPPRASIRTPPNWFRDDSPGVRRRFAALLRMILPPSCWPPGCGRCSCPRRTGARPVGVIAFAWAAARRYRRLHRYPRPMLLTWGARGARAGAGRGADRGSRLQPRCPPANEGGPGLSRLQGGLATISSIAHRCGATSGTRIGWTDFWQTSSMRPTSRKARLSARPA